MKTFPPAQTPEALLFDIDNTLYQDGRYGFTQVESLVRRLAEHRSETLEYTRVLIQRARDQITSRTGRKPSLGNTFVALGIPIATSVAWRKELMHPEQYLTEDAELREILETLATRYSMAAITNNPEEIGIRTLDVLGVGSIFDVVVGLDTTMQSKPAWEPFKHALETLDVIAARAVVVGDRYDVDLAPVICRGGGGILVEERADLRRISAVLEQES